MFRGIRSIWIPFAFLQLLFSQPVRTATTPGLGDYDLSFMPEGVYDETIQSPTDFFQFPIGARPLTHEEIVRYFNYLDESPRAELRTYGETWEGRALIYLVISAEDNLSNLQSIRRTIDAFYDPRGKSADDLTRKIPETPAVAWMQYSIHGDELSSSDAAVFLAYQLVAGTDPQSQSIRKNLVTIIDPLQNPDGRERYLAQMRSWNSVVPNPDNQSISHNGTWPWGRGNHYLFDLNRDWFTTTQPESRGKVAAILDWHPQLIVDAHEMGALDTYLFNPPRAPYNPYLPEYIHRWWDRYARDQADAFDRYGWSYYTREWNEELFPGYGSSWGMYSGAVGILYEQSQTDGSLVKRPDRTETTFREAIHHQFTSSFANLLTTAKNKNDLLQDYLRHSLSEVQNKAAGGFLFVPDANSGRWAEFLSTLRRQNIEYKVLNRPGKLADVQDINGQNLKRKSFPAGTMVVPLNQPLNSLIQNILGFDIRLSNKILKKERVERLKYGAGTIYDVTAWSLSLAFNQQAYYAPKLGKLALSEAPDPSVDSGLLINPNPQFGWVFSNQDDRVFEFLAALFRSEVNIWCSKKPFSVGGQAFPSGSFLIKRTANPELNPVELDSIARRAGIAVIGINTALATDGVDLGGGEFNLLAPPRVAMLTAYPVSSYSFGSLWYLLDSRIRTRVSLLNAAGATRTDLNKYNVIILPSMYGGSSTIRDILGQSGINRLESWMRNGGTLIAIGSSAAFCADSATGMSSVTLRRQSLNNLEDYETGLDHLLALDYPEIDSLNIWEAKPGPEESAESKRKLPDLKILKDRDRLGRQLRPQGAILQVNIEPRHWLTFGCRNTIPVLANSSNVFLTTEPMVAAARFAPEFRLRLSGLLWPEARERMARSAWVTREAYGNGQLILFAGEPYFRAYFQGTKRIFLNAVMTGPGMGAQHPVEW